jgi:mitochondrial fission protein ELM1
MVALSSVVSDPRMVGAPVVWVLHDGKAGMASQALGVAEAAGFPFEEKALRIVRPWIWATPALWVAPLHHVTQSGISQSGEWQSGRRLTPPWPDAVIGCGRNAVRPALAIKRASGGRTIAVHIQDPRFGRKHFDLMIVPRHDRLRGPRVLVTDGAVHRVTPRFLDAEARRFPALAALPRPIVGLLVGGANGAYRFEAAMLAEIADRIAAAVRRCGGSLVATPSRRTEPNGVRLMRDRLAGISGDIWDGTGENPYYAYLAVADALIVTADSVSMVSEAAATGKPVHVIDLPGGDAKFARFHAAMRGAGITRPFSGDIEDWAYRPPDDTARAGAALRDLIGARLTQQARRECAA